MCVQEPAIDGNAPRARGRLWRRCGRSTCRESKMHAIESLAPSHESVDPNRVARIRDFICPILFIQTPLPNPQSLIARHESVIINTKTRIPTPEHHVPNVSSLALDRETISPQC